MLKSLLKDRFLVLLFLFALLIKLASLNSSWVEQKYSNGIYPPLGSSLRALLGFFPFSVGDLLYAAAGLYLFYLLYKAIVAIRAKGFLKVLPGGLRKGLKIALVIYIWFNAFWGLNYNRLGIGHQLALQKQPYSLNELTALTLTLQQRLNFYAAQVDTTERINLQGSALQKQTVAAYAAAQKPFFFLLYPNPTIKPSLFTGVGHYFGFTGYYNPFTGEAQIKTTIPSFLKPFVALHEVAHQLGYAKENEANFIAYLVGKNAGNSHFLYALYYEMYRYALREIGNRDVVLAQTFKQQLHPRVLADNEQLKAYLLSTKNKIEPLMTLFYDQFLKANRQQSGVQTYNEVVALLLAYSKKVGLQAI